MLDQESLETPQAILQLYSKRADHLLITFRPAKQTLKLNKTKFKKHMNRQDTDVSFKWHKSHLKGLFFLI